MSKHQYPSRTILYNEEFKLNAQLEPLIRLPFDGVHDSLHSMIITVKTASKIILRLIDMANGQILFQCLLTPNTPKLTVNTVNCLLQSSPKHLTTLELHAMALKHEKQAYVMSTIFNVNHKEERC